jgi:putative transposase
MFMLPGDDPKELVNLLGYCLAYAANEFGIEVHACVVMSDHHHTNITDPHGQLPAFKQLFHSLIARAINARLNRVDSFWSGDGGCDTRRPTDDETLNDLVYTITNPVKDGLVKWSRLWPGFTTEGWEFGETRTFKRPKWFFDKNGEMPERASLTLARPRIFAGLGDDDLFAKLALAVRQREMEHQESFHRRNQRFMGIRKLARQDPNSAARSYEERFVVKPKVAASSRSKRLPELQRDRQWAREYADARERHLSGLPAVFPWGTYWMRRFAAVEVAQRPPP